MYILLSKSHFLLKLKLPMSTDKIINLLISITKMKRQKEKERSFAHCLTLQSLSQELPVGLPHGWHRPKDLGHLPLPSQAHYQKARIEVSL